MTDLKWIGGGGFGAVYRGFQTEFDRDVAVKVLQVTVADRKARSSFDRERKVMGRLSSRTRNVVTVLGSGILDDGRPYLLTEYCAGGSLAGRPPMPVGAVLHLGVRIAQALRVAHAEGVVHRDVKPANILQRADGEAALADFGLSIRPSHDLSRGLDALAPEYAAPESLHNGHYDAATDMYALGATLYALLESTPPFAHRTGEALMAYLTRVLRDPVPPPRHAVLPPQLWQLITELLAKEPADRPDAAAVATRLASLQSVHPPEPAGTGAAGAGPAFAAAPPGGDTTRLRDGAAEPQMTGTDGERTRLRANPHAGTEPARERRRLPVAAVLGALAVVVVLGGASALTVFGLRDGSDESTSAPVAAPTSAAAPAVVLAEPVDNSTSVRLSWSARAGLQYAVIVGEQGRAPRTELVRGRSSTSVRVTPGTPYCFQVQATDGGPVLTSNVRAIRGAVCSFG